ncbi:MAG TPA: FG-GAP-like repeat-containing protein [Phycisphaerae bacterium]|nr:FG-GAP-like repeat-containing protein [Phycisphaerae bacterium]
MTIVTSRMWRRFAAASAVFLFCASVSSAQQFVEDTATRFPPSPNSYTNQLTIGDIDNDGDLDIIFANGGGFGTAGTPEPQRVYINDGNGVFTDQSATRLNFSGLCRGAELGDIDNDGDLDLVFAQDFNRRPGLFLNNGSGFFTNVTSQRLPAINLSSSRGQFGDIDNDGDLDLYFVNGGPTNRFGCGQYRVYVNNGLGFFADETATRHPIGTVCEPMDCIFGDIDGDFDLDVCTAARSGPSRIYRNNGAGNFTTFSDIAGDSSTYSYDFGDMDGDGDLDLLGANAGSGNTELLLANDGAGAYTNASSQLQSNPGIDDNDSKFFDYDDDGDMDIIIAALGSGPERILTRGPSGSYTLAAGAITAIPGGDSSLDIKVADLDNDGALDVVTGQGESNMPFVNRIYMNQGPSDTHPPRVISMEQLPDTDDLVGPYVVRAAVLDDMTSDRNFFNKGVFLNFAVNDGLFDRVAMRHSGGQIYRGIIPSQPCGGTISYFVSASDWADNVGEGATKTFQLPQSGPLRFVFNGGDAAPSLAAPCAPFAFQLDIENCTETFEPGTAVLHYQVGEEDVVSIPLTSLGGTAHEGTFPGFRCGDIVGYYISAMSISGQTIHYPPLAPAEVFRLDIGELEPQVIFAENFESGMPSDWSATGLWNVTGACPVNPVCDGSSWAYYGDSAQCHYNTGATNVGLLTPPAVTLPASPVITLSYCSTFEREAFTILDWPSLLINGAVVDQPALGGLGSTPWVVRTVDLTSYAGQTVTLAWRFNTVIAPSGNFRGWQVDDIVLTADLPVCNLPALAGDLNADGLANGADVQTFTEAALAESTDPQFTCPGDFTGDGAVTHLDIPQFVDVLIE